jgi:hypothetical protein
VSWEIANTKEWGDWFDGLSVELQDAIAARLELLAERGPALGRPTVDTLTGSELPNLKELRVDADGQNTRTLFVFDPTRTAILLMGGSKTGQWSKWYRTAIPQAERLYEEHLRE